MGKGNDQDEAPHTTSYIATTSVPWIGVGKFGAKPTHEPDFLISLSTHDWNRGGGWAFLELKSWYCTRIASCLDGFCERRLLINECTSRRNWEGCSSMVIANASALCLLKRGGAVLED